MPVIRLGARYLPVASVSCGVEPGHSAPRRFRPCGCRSIWVKMPKNSGMGRDPIALALRLPSYWTKPVQTLSC
jgi:hypothetical protein